MKNSEKKEDWLLAGTTQVITEEQAKKEILTWVNLRKLPRRKRLNLKAMFENAMLAMVDGDLSLIDGKFVQVLSDERKLHFQDRLSMQEFTRVLEAQGIDDEDGDGRLAAAVSVLTNKTYAEVSELEGDDRALANSIALFFM